MTALTLLARLSVPLTFASFLHAGGAPRAVENEDLSLAGLKNIEKPSRSLLSTDRFELALTYNALVQAALHAGDTGGSGELHLGGRWVFINQDFPSKLVERLGGTSDGLLCLKFRLRHRHRILDESASSLSGRIGAFLGTTDGFSDSGFEIPDLYIQQIFHDGKFELRYGQLDVEARLDSHAMRSSKKAFLNRVFSTNPTVAFPRFGAGGTARWQATEHFDLTYALTQVQASKSGTQVDFDLNANDLFTALQAGFTWGEEESTQSHIQFMAWAADSTKDEAEDYGLSVGYETHFGDSDKTVFVRLSSGQGKQSDLDRMAVIGYGESFRENDLLGVGIGTGRSSDNNDIQGVLEVFYRYQAPFNIEITPDIQFLVGEGLKGDYDIVAGLRGIVSF